VDRLPNTPLGFDKNLVQGRLNEQATMTLEQ